MNYLNYNYLSEYIDDLLNEIKTIINSGLIKYEISERSPRNKKEAKEAIYLVFESLLNLILNNKLITNEKNNKIKYFAFLQTIKQAYDLLIKLN